MPTYRYHWTSTSNLKSIATSGLDPANARGTLRVVWCCEWERVLWAVGHVARHHETAPDEMVLLRIRIDGLPTKPSSWPRVTLLTRRVTPGRICVATAGIGSRWRRIGRAK